MLVTIIISLQEGDSKYLDLIQYKYTNYWQKYMGLEGNCEELMHTVCGLVICWCTDVGAGVYLSLQSTEFRNV